MALRERRRCQTMLMATDAAGPFARLHKRAAAHGLNHHAILVEELEIDELLRRHREIGRAVGLDRHGAEDAFILQAVPVHARGGVALADPFSMRPRPLLRRFDHAEALYGAALRAVQVGALIDILHIEVSLGAGKIPTRGDNRRTRARPERHRIVAAAPLHVQEDFVAKGVHQEHPHLRAAAGHARAEEVFFTERIGIGVFVLRVEGVVAIESAARAHKGGSLRRPGADNTAAAIHPKPAVNDRHRPPEVVVMRSEDADHLLGAGNLARRVGRPRHRRVVAPENRMVHPIRRCRPQAVRVPEIAVHIFPASVEDTAIFHQRGLVVEEVVALQLVNVRPVALHAVEVGGDVLAALVIFGLARGREQDAVVGQIDRVEVAHTRCAGQLPEAGAIGVDLPQVPILTRMSAQGEDDLLSAEIHVRVACNALRHLDHRPGLAPLTKVYQLHRPASLEVARVGFPGMEERINGVVAAPVLRTHDVKNGLVADQRIGDQRLALQRGEFGAGFKVGARPQARLDLTQPGQELTAARIAPPERRHQVLHRAAQTGGLFRRECRAHRVGMPLGHLNARLPQRR